jgi:adenosine deaminase
MSDFIDMLPKAELHLHIEGTLEPEMMFRFANKNGVDVPYASVEELRSAYRFRNLQDFLELYCQCMRVLREEQDFYDLTWAYFEKVHGQSVFHAEIFFDPQAHTARGVPFPVVVGGIHRAMRDAETELGITSKLIMCFLRHLDEQDAMATLEEAIAYRDHIVAIGLDSSELGNRPSKFQSVFRRARAEGFLAVAHAGEEGPAAYVREALDALGVVRIDHGNRSLDDVTLVRRLAMDRILLTICPLSNLRLGVAKSLEAHPLRTMLEQGLCGTVNSDDPAYFGGYINENYRAVREALDLTEKHLVIIARNSFQASFLGEAAKTALIRKVDAYARAN